MPVLRFLAKVIDWILSDPSKDYKQYKKALWHGLDKQLSTILTHFSHIQYIDILPKNCYFMSAIHFVV